MRVIHLGAINGDFKCVQTLVAPSVYLDHCAFRNISDDVALSKRFVEGVKDRNGTLVVSALNRIEFSGVTDANQALHADALITQMWPNLFFMDVQVVDVSAREKAHRAGTLEEKYRCPCDDVSQLEALSKHLSVQDGRINWPSNGLFLEALRRRDLHKPTFDADKKAGQQFMMEFRKNHAVDKLFLKKNRDFLRAFGKGQLRGKISSFAVMTHMMLAAVKAWPKFDDNDMSDFFHACVPSAYCDFVVLDSRWCDLVDRVRREFSKYSIGSCLARVFPPSAKGIEMALREIEACLRSPAPTVHVKDINARIASGQNGYVPVYD